MEPKAVEYFNLSFLFLCRKRILRSRGILFLVWPGLFANLGQFGIKVSKVFDMRACIISLLFLFREMASQSKEFRAWDIFSWFPLFKLNDERVVVWLGVEGLSEFIVNWRLCAVLHVMIAWSDREDDRWDIWLIKWWLFVNIKSRVFDPPVWVVLVPNVIFWSSWWVSQVSINLLSIRDSGELPCGRVAVPSRHMALGKLKSPASIMSGTGVFKFEMTLLILSMMVLKDSSR